MISAVQINRLPVILMLLLIVISSCSRNNDNLEPKECTGVDDVEKTVISVTDDQAGSPFQGKVVLQYTLEQDFKSYSNNCKPTAYGSTILKIKNMTNKQIEFGFILTFERDNETWDFEEAPIIDAGATIDLGIINNLPVKVNGGRIEITPTIPFGYY